MTEEEWQVSTDPRAVFSDCGRWVSERKRRLVSLAACSLVAQLSEFVHLPAFMVAAEQFADKPDVLMGNNNAHRVTRRMLHRAKNRTGEAVARAVGMLFQGDTSAAIMHVLDARGQSPHFSVSDEELAALIRDIFGNPFRPVAFDPRWRSETVVALAAGIYTDRAFDRLPILADALEEAGCDNADVLSHCRGPGPHARGCWVVDLVLGKS